MDIDCSWAAPKDTRLESLQLLSLMTVVVVSELFHPSYTTLNITNFSNEELIVKSTCWLARYIPRFLMAVIKPHDQSNLQKKEFNCAYSSRGLELRWLSKDMVARGWRSSWEYTSQASTRRQRKLIQKVFWHPKVHPQCHTSSHATPPKQPPSGGQIFKWPGLMGDTGHPNHHTRPLFIYPTKTDF